MPSSLFSQTSRTSCGTTPVPLAPAAPWQVYSQHQQQPNQGPAGSSTPPAVDLDPLDTDEDDLGGMEAIDGQAHRIDAETFLFTPAQARVEQWPLAA